MMTVVAASLVVVMTGAAEAHHNEWGAYRFELADEAPTLGDNVYFRLVWTNRSKKTVRIPADLWKRASITGEVCPLSGCRGRHKFGFGKALKPTPASKVKWQTVGPREEVEYLGSFDALFPKQCKKGCEIAQYVVSVSMGQQQVAPLAKDMVLPKNFGQRIRVTVLPRLLPVRNPNALSVKARFGTLDKKAKALPFTLEVRNTLPWPMWFPKGDPLYTSCSVEMTLADGEGAGTVGGLEGGSTRPFDESKAVVLQPGKVHTVKGKCFQVDPAVFTKAVSATASLSVGSKAYYQFLPTKSTAAVHYFDTRHSISKLKVK